MAMSRRDYRALAAALRKARDGAWESRQLHPCCMEMFQSIVSNVSSVLADDNPRFDRAMFEDAAGYRPGE